MREGPVRLAHGSHRLTGGAEVAINKNGSRVLVESTGSSDGIVHLAVQINIGSDHEVGDVPLEAAHLLEHMVAAMTTPDRPSTSETASDRDSRGIETNAVTTDHGVTYYVVGPATLPGRPAGENAEYMWRDLMRHVACNTTRMLDRKEFESELAAVNHELDQARAQEEGPVEEFINKALNPQTGGKKNPRWYSEGDRLASIAKWPSAALRKRLTDIRGRWYQPQLTTVVAVGAVSPSLQRSIVEDMAKLQKGGTALDPPVSSDLSGVLGRVIAVPTPSRGNPRVVMVAPLRFGVNNYRRVATADAMCSLLSEGFSSRLMKRLRTELGAIYGVKAHTVLAHRAPESLLRVEFACDPSKLETAVEEATCLCADLAFGRISDNELAKWKNGCAKRLAELKHATPTERAESYSAALPATDTPPSPEEVVEMELAVDRRRIRDEAARVFASPKQSATFVSGVPAERVGALSEARRRGFERALRRRCKCD